ncbi:GIY-YIG nuclease family protein [Streptomyces sp. SAJ15]|uniref:GIY-YIG nuclease family protein n=1 Tax=Streptomyces sp. SAJ15 TaxID=2011095 RepID=UPI00164262D2|nr:GntR family transcriptional regulator [Streptomyces sp. SAJ15]
MPERTALYRLYDAEDRLLYIGITTDPEARWERHALLKWWWSQVDRKDLTWLNVSWRDALTAEAEAILEGRPKFNGVHNYRPAPFDGAAWPQIQPGRGKARALAALIRAEVETGRWQHGDRLPPWRGLATATGVSRTTVDLAYRELINEGLIERLPGVGTFVSVGGPVKRPNRQLAPGRQAAR